MARPECIYGMYGATSIIIDLDGPSFSCQRPYLSGLTDVMTLHTPSTEDIMIVETLELVAMHKNKSQERELIETLDEDNETCRLIARYMASHYLSGCYLCFSIFRISIS